MKVFVHDEYPPETLAMLQALYSRSSFSVEKHLEKVRSRGSSDFMRSYYVGYGHSSIGDCGNTTIFIEGVSLLACKAIQNSQLYSGQETSTRYIDFSGQIPFDPLGNSASRQILEKWREFYVKAHASTTAWLAERCERPAGTSETTWGKAVNARAFDVARGFLPAGVTSQLSWSTSLRHAHEHLMRLSSHPLAEVVAIGQKIEESLKERYPSSFSHSLDDRQREYFRKLGAREEYFKDSQAAGHTLPSFCSTVENEVLEREGIGLIDGRPWRCPLPKEFERFGQFQLRFLLDFGSFRDLQRHRNGFCRMPLLSGSAGFHNWYFENLPPDIATAARELVRDQFAQIDVLQAEARMSEQEFQYFFPLGTLVPCELTYSLPEIVYVTELRSGEAVHPTLRQVAQWMGAELIRHHPKLTLYTDNSPDSFHVSRGLQDIVELPVA